LVYRATYTPTASNPMSDPEFNDPVYYLVKSTTTSGVVYSTVPMTKTDTGYLADVRIPSVTLNVEMQAFILYDELYDATVKFSVDPGNASPQLPGQAMYIMDNADEALQVERERYPWNYSAYLQWLHRFTTSSELDPIHPHWDAFTAVLDSLGRLKAAGIPITTRFCLTQHVLLKKFKGNVADADHSLIDAAKVFRGTPDDIASLNDPLLWSYNTFVDENDQGRYAKQDLITAYERLALQYPGTRMARLFVYGLTPATDIDPVSLKAMVDYYTSTDDADMLVSLANVLVEPNGKHFDPIIAECLYRMAVESCYLRPFTLVMFDLYPSRQTRDYARIGIARALIEQGNLEAAKVELDLALRSRESFAGSHEARLLLLELGRRTGNIHLARQAAATFLGLKDIGRYPSLEYLYKVDARPTESFEQYARRQRENHYLSGWNPPPPDVLLRTVDGSTAQLSDYLGKVVILSMYSADGTQSVVQRKAVNTLRALYKGNEDVVIVEVFPNGSRPAPEVLQEQNQGRLFVLDDGSIRNQIRSTTGAAFIVVDRKGRTFSWRTAFNLHLSASAEIYVRTALSED
jgi:hypothetical protein